MHNQQQQLQTVRILKAIFQKAESTGWERPVVGSELIFLPREMGKATAIDTWTEGVLLSHSFARAFWGEKAHMTPDGMMFKEWEWQLQRIVVLPMSEKIEYLKKFL